MLLLASLLALQPTVQAEPVLVPAFTAQSEIEAQRALASRLGEGWRPYASQRRGSEAPTRGLMRCGRGRETSGATAVDGRRAAGRRAAAGCSR